MMPGYPRAHPEIGISRGWTSDSLGYEWLTRVFEPCTRPEDPTIRRLLIMDGHSSHVTANVMALYMEDAIDLLILPPHSSHILQPLDVSVFAPLKCALASETDVALRHDAGRIPRVQWVETYIRARGKALNKHNILSGWRSAGLMPLSPITVLTKLPTNATPVASPPHTPAQQIDLDLSLLDSSPSDSTELRQASALLNTAIQACRDLSSPAKRFTARMTRALETANSENVTLKKEIKEQTELLRTRKARRKGKRIALKGRFVFSTQEVLEIARSAEQESSERKAATKGRKHRPKSIWDVDKGSEIITDDSESNCIVASMRE